MQGQLVAVSYAFEVWEGGERRLVTEEGVSASTLGMLVPQLDATAKRTRVDQGPGLLVFDNYRDARQAAQAVAAVAARVAIHEVDPATVLMDEGWSGASGTRYSPTPGGIAQVIKG